MNKEVVGPHSALDDDFKPLVMYHQECYACTREFLSPKISTVCSNCVLTGYD